MVTRAAIYTWFRGEAQDDPTEDNAAQEERCRAYAAAEGYTVVDVYRETARLPTDDRPELKRLRTAIWLSRVDVVIATRPDRFYLDLDRLQRLASDARLRGVRLEFLEAPVILEGLLQDG